MEINILVGVKISEKEKYDMSLNIPTTDLTPQSPFKFTVSSELENNASDNVLQVAFSDSKHVCVQVKPPKSLLETAGIDDYIDKLQVVVEEGNYDSSTGTFEVDSE